MFSWIQRIFLLKLKRTANDISRKHCKLLEKSATSLEINLICGHTHNPRLTKHYSNTGCFSYLSGCGNALEIEGDKRTLVKWSPGGDRNMLMLKNYN